MKFSKKELCEGCLDVDSAHRCRSNPDFCIDGVECADFIGEDNCGCLECGVQV